MHPDFCRSVVFLFWWCSEGKVLFGGLLPSPPLGRSNQVKSIEFLNSTLASLFCQSHLIGRILGLFVLGPFFLFCKFPSWPNCPNTPTWLMICCLIWPLSIVGTPVRVIWTIIKPWSSGGKWKSWLEPTNVREWGFIGSFAKTMLRDCLHFQERTSVH